MNQSTILIALLSLFAACVRTNQEPCIEPINLIETQGLKFSPKAKEPFSGETCVKFPNGKPQSSGQYRAGLPIGMFTFWNIDGFKAMEDFYDDNGRIIRKTTFHPGTEQKASETLFENDRQDGISRTWWKNGQLKTSETYSAGTLHGSASGWHKNGQVAWEKQYAFGQVSGIEKTWFENGQQQSALIYCGSNILELLSWDSLGKKVFTPSALSIKKIKADLIDIIQDLQLTHVGISRGSWAYECFTDANLAAFHRDKTAENIRQSIKSKCSFLSLSIAYKKLPLAAKDHIRQTGLRCYKPTWGQLGQISSAGQTAAGQLAEKLVSKAVVAALDDLSKMPINDLLKIAQ